MPTPQAPRTPLPAGIWALGFVSLLMDVSSELIHSLLPVFMVTVLGASMLTVGLIEGAVKRPQMQWNRLSVSSQNHPLIAGADGAWMYFVHSYAAPSGDEVIATCDYGGAVTAAVARDNVWAVQFHPEKSGDAGLALLENFVAYVGSGS